jgi:sugar transferase (PEP-CTERM/EpsH1 system associated)
MSDASSVLFLVHRIPFPPDKGDKIRSFHLLRALASRYRVHLGTFIDDPADWEHVDALKQWCATTKVLALDRRWATVRSAQGLLSNGALTDPFYRDSALHEYVRATLAHEKIRAIVAMSSSMAQYMPALPGVRRVIDFCDVDSDKWTQYSQGARWPMSWVYRREGRLLERREAEIARACDASIFVSQAEADLFARLHRECASRVHVVPNGVDAAHFSPTHPLANPFATDERAIVFTGAMDYWANVDAVAWFAREVLPAVRQRMPRAVFWIVGSNPTPAVRSLEADGVRVTGRVPDVRPYVKYASLVVAPLRLARGVQNKVLEAMAMGQPVLASPAAVRGIDVATPPGITVADAPADFASAAIAHLEAGDNDARGAAARAFVRQNFDWQRNLAVFIDLVGEPANAPAAVRAGAAG